MTTTKDHRKPGPKPKARVVLDLGTLGTWPLEVDAGVLGRLELQAAADGQCVLADQAEARRFSRYLEEMLLAMVRREFAPPTAAQRSTAARSPSSSSSTRRRRPGNRNRS